MKFYKSIAISIFSLLLALSANAGEFLTLDLGDQLKQARRGDDTIPLRALINRQHPGMNLRGKDLMSVLLVAKSAAGHGTASLLVGRSIGAPQFVDGNRAKFVSNSEDSFDRVLFKNPSLDSQGVWQIKLNGRFIIHQAVVEVASSALEVVLQYHDMHIRGRRGNNIIPLRQDLLSQLGIRSQDYELKSIELKAKSRAGMGRAALIVGQSVSTSANLAGRPGIFHDNHISTYDTDVITNPSLSSAGRWQVEFNGNIKVKQIKLILEKK